jgi:hypothetical protein
MISKEEFKQEALRIQHAMLDGLTAISPIEDPACVVVALLNIATSTAVIHGNLDPNALKGLLNQSIDVLIAGVKDGSVPLEPGTGLFLRRYLAGKRKS